MRYSKELIGKHVITIDEGRFIGTVRDVYLSADLKWLAGIHMGKEGFIKRRSLVIPRGSIAVFGVDAILAKNANVITNDKDNPDIQAWHLLNKVQGREVDTPGGTRLGIIGDAILDGEARVAGFLLARVFVEGPIAEERTIMKEAILDYGLEDGVMTIDLAKVEQQGIEKGD